MLRKKTWWNKCTLTRLSNLETIQSWSRLNPVGRLPMLKPWKRKNKKVWESYLNVTSLRRCRSLNCHPKKTFWTQNGIQFRVNNSTQVSEIHCKQMICEAIQLLSPWAFTFNHSSLATINPFIPWLGTRPINKILILPKELCTHTMQKILRMTQSSIHFKGPIRIVQAMWWNGFIILIGVHDIALAKPNTTSAQNLNNNLKPKTIFHLLLWTN